MSTSSSAAALTLRGVRAGYGDVTVLRDVDLTVDKGEVLGIFGANGAGKTTLLRTISRLTTLFAGEVVVCGQDVSRARPEEVSRLGLAHVPEGRRVFSGMTVEDNLLVSARGPRKDSMKLLESTYAQFPRLGDRRAQRAESLSGGEQQLLAIGRALMMSPSVIMLDEPSQGLSPVAVQGVIQGIQQIVSSGLTAIVVEQNLHVLLPIVTRAATVSRGAVHPVEDLAELGSATSLTDLLGGGLDL